MNTVLEHRREEIHQDSGETAQDCDCNIRIEIHEADGDSYHIREIRLPEQGNRDRRDIRRNGQGAEEQGDPLSAAVKPDCQQQSEKGQNTAQSCGPDEDPAPVAEETAQRGGEETGHRREHSHEGENPCRADFSHEAEILQKFLADDRLEYIVQPEIDPGKQKQTAVVAAFEQFQKRGETERNILNRRHFQCEFDSDKDQVSQKGCRGYDLQHHAPADNLHSCNERSIRHDSAGIADQNQKSEHYREISGKSPGGFLDQAQVDGAGSESDNRSAEIEHEERVRKGEYRGTDTEQERPRCDDSASSEAVHQKPDDQLVQCVNIHECRAEIRDIGSGNIQAFLKFIKDGAGNGDSLDVGEEVKNGTAEEKNP